MIVKNSLSIMILSENRAKRIENQQEIDISSNRITAAFSSFPVSFLLAVLVFAVSVLS